MKKPPLLITFPGKLGDLLWAMASVKTLAARYEVTLLVSKYCEPLVPLLKLQPYLKDIVVDERWEIQFTAPVTPSTPPSLPLDPLDEIPVLHLGLPGWPSPTLVEAFGKIARVEPSRPPWLFWNVAPPPTKLSLLAWTDEWVELKVGLTHALNKLPSGVYNPVVMLNPRSRLDLEFDLGTSTSYCGEFASVADWVSTAACLITDKSVMRVLAYALGVPTIVVEPSPPRHQAVFDPPKVGWPQDAVLINGFDAREVVQAVRGFLEKEKKR